MTIKFKNTLLMIFLLVSMKSYAQSTIFGVFEENITGDGGEPYGAELSKIIRVDVYEFLKNEFKNERIKPDNPLYILKDKLDSFKKLLDEENRVYAVDNIIDSFGEEVLARVVPLSQYYAGTLNPNTRRYEVTFEDVDILHISKVRNDSSSTLVLELSNNPLLSEIKITTKKEDFSYARLRAQPDIPGVQLPPGAKFYTHCASPLDISNLGSKAFELELLCGPYNIEGMTAHLKGILHFDETGQVTKSTLTVSLSLRTFIIQFNKKKFEELRKTTTLSILQRTIFHEYLRLLGIDDQGYVVSSYLDIQHRALTKTPTHFPYIGASVIVKRGSEKLVMANNQVKRFKNASLSQRSFVGTISGVWDVNFQNFKYTGPPGHRVRRLDSTEHRQIVEVRHEIAPGLWEPSVFFVEDVTYVP